MGLGPCSLACQLGLFCDHRKRELPSANGGVGVVFSWDVEAGWGLVITASLTTREMMTHCKSSGVGWGCCFLFAWCSSCTGNLQVALGPVLKRVAGFALIPPAEAYPLYPIYILPSLGLCQSSDLSLQKQKKRLSNVSLGISTEYLSSSEWHVKTWIGWLSLWRAGSAMQPGAQS